MSLGITPHFNGMPIFISPNCLGDGHERLFPESKHRSKRIHKKLIKRFGTEFKQIPCIYKTEQGFHMHPLKYEEFLRELQNRSTH